MVKQRADDVKYFKRPRNHLQALYLLMKLMRIAPKREDTFGDVEKRVVAQLLALMDGMAD